MELIEDEGFLNSVSVSGRILGTLFLQRPNTPDCRKAAEALLAEPFVTGWPFGDVSELEKAYSLMETGYAPVRADEDGMDDLVSEYNRLFIGPAPKPAPQWGSVYLDRESVLFGSSLIELHRWMRANGVVTEYTEKEPEDHIGRMFILMAILAEQRPELLPEFLQEHLLTWSSHYFGEFIEGTDNAFYQGLATLADTTLLDMRDLLGLDVPRKRFYR